VQTPYSGERDASPRWGGVGAMGDRTEWIKGKVTHNLGVSETLFAELLERQGPDSKTYWESLNAFLDHEDTVESVAMFYTTEELVGGTEGTWHAQGCMCTLHASRNAALFLCLKFPKAQFFPYT